MKRYVLALTLFLPLPFLAGPANGAETVIWQEVESLSTTGGWSNDSQHVDIMGSPYLLATGAGHPVADALGEVEISEAGNYRLWVRCRDWYPSFSPGIFSVSVDGRKSEATFGNASEEGWRWIDGGRFDLEKGKAELRLSDLSGWWGRCDALVLAKGDFQPANEPAALAAQRLKYAGVSPERKDAGEFDVVVVGGGSSGIGAALAAARNGIRVAFIQDRPVLGGNGSSEIMVPPMGVHGKAPDQVNVTGIAEELYPAQEWTNFADSANIGEIVAREPNISLFLNTRATGVEMKDESTLAAVLSLDVHSGQRLRFRAPIFIDTTGHGWIGFYAGAEWRMGTEGRDEFGESLAPEAANPHTMGNSLYRADFRDMGKPDPFVTPEWAFQFTSPDDFKEPVERVKEALRPELFDEAKRGAGRPISATGPKRGGAFTWFVELGGMDDTIADAEKIRDELFRLHVGLWGYSKNYDEEGVEANRNLRLVWLNYVPGVRESRRLIGDYIMTQADFDDEEDPHDIVAFTDWGIDDHHPFGFFTEGIDGMHVYGGKRIGIPYRSLYSKNIRNLMMAGRCMSASHMALSGVRVQRPMTATGQAVGTAAVIAVKNGVTPREVGEKFLTGLQQTLLKDGCFLPGIKSEDPLDLARKAQTDFPVLIDGWNREVRGVSRPVPWRTEPLKLRFSRPEKIACVHLSLSNRHHAAAFAIEGRVDGKWKQLAETPGDAKQRRYVINFEPVQTDQVRFRLLRSSGPVSVAEVRLYAEPGNATADGLPEAAGFPTVMDNAEREAKEKTSVENFPGTVVDDRDAYLTGGWVRSNFGEPVMGGGYQHDGAAGDGGATATFAAVLPKPGRYEVQLAYVAYGNRASNVPVTIEHSAGRETVTVDQKKAPPIDGKFLSLGTFRFEKEGTVTLTNKDTDGHVVADGVQWLPAE